MSATVSLPVTYWTQSSINVCSREHFDAEPGVAEACSKCRREWRAGADVLDRTVITADSLPGGLPLRTEAEALAEIARRVEAWAAVRRYDAEEEERDAAQAKAV
jgi:hypothetical protein